MSFPTDWSVEDYKNDYESNEQWELRRSFMERWKGNFSEDQLVCLARVFTNIEFLGCRYPAETMRQVAELSKEVAFEFREKKKKKIQRTFVSASDAAEDRAKGIKRPASEQGVAMKSLGPPAPKVFVAAQKTDKDHFDTSKRQDDTSRPSFQQRENQKDSTGLSFQRGESQKGSTGPSFQQGESQTGSTGPSFQQGQSQKGSTGLSFQQGKGQKGSTGPSFQQGESQKGSTGPSFQQGHSQKGSTGLSFQQNQNCRSDTPSFQQNQNFRGSNATSFQQGQNLRGPDRSNQQGLNNRGSDRNAFQQTRNKDRYERKKNKQLKDSQDDSIITSKYGTLVLYDRPTSYICRLISSCQASRISLNIVFQSESETKWKCNVTINNILVASGTGPSQKESKEAAAKEAWSVLRKTCYTLVVKQAYASKESKVISIDDVQGNQGNKQIDALNTKVESAIATRMMNLMGWSGGALGSTGDGISEPIAPNLKQIRRAGLGCSGINPNIRGALTQTIREFSQNEDTDYDLVFAADFKKEERADMHKVALNFGLKSKSYGKDSVRYLVISKPVVPSQLISSLLAKGGSNEKFTVLRPGEPDP